jgi:NAD(P)-dependent dehydrogenase (short-subunit alcohol dehydrogenase family)
LGENDQLRAINFQQSADSLKLFNKTLGIPLWMRCKSIVTGGAEGIGEATARIFAREGAKTVIADINRTKGEVVAEEIRSGGGEAVFIHLDVTSEGNWQSLMKETIDKFSKLNVLVNNAGIIKIADIENTSLEDWHRIIDVAYLDLFLASDESRWITGCEFNVDGGFTA